MTSKTIKVLLIEDYKIDQMALDDWAKSKAKIIEYAIAGSVTKATKLLETNHFDVIVADYQLGDGTAFDLFDIIGDIPIIFITGAGDEETAVKAMKAGVYDYIVKDIDRLYLDKLLEIIEKAYEHRKMSQKSKTIKITVDRLTLARATEGIVFCNTRIGPTLAFTPSTFLFSEEDYLKMGVFFYLAVGQGNVRNYGLFELPVPGFPNFRSFVYSFDVLDPDNQDPHSQGKNYCLLVFLFPTWVQEFLVHPFELEKIIREKLVDITALEQLKSPKVFDRLYPHIFV